MRDYGVVRTSFWTSPSIMSLDDNSKVIALYLLTGPHTNLLGCFRIPLSYIAEDIDKTVSEIKKGFNVLKKEGFATYDDKTKWIYLPKYLDYNKPENVNQGKAILKILDSIPSSSVFFNDVLDNVMRAKNRFPAGYESVIDEIKSKRLVFNNPSPRVFEPVNEGKDLFNDGLETVTNTDSDSYSDSETDSKEKHSSDKPDQLAKDVQEIFEFWKVEMEHPRSKLQPDRVKTIKKALSLGFDVEQLKLAIKGCSNTDWNMGRDPKSQKVFDSLDLIFRKGSKIEEFIELSGGTTERPIEDSFTY